MVGGVYGVEVFKVVLLGENFVDVVCKLYYFVEVLCVIV